MRHAAWLRDLEGAQHLFDADVAYFLTTASAINSQSKTVVMTAEHSRLLTTGQIELKNYSVLKPPPIADHFRGLYTSLHDSIVAGTAAPLLTLDDFPARPPQIPSHHLISPDRIIQIDMKLRNNLLALITSRGRRRHYQDLTRSGCELLRIIAADAKASASVYVQSPHIRKLKAQLEVMKKMTMTKISMVEFDAIRDGIEEINDQLEAGDRMTDVQLCDHYIGLLQKLNSHGVRLALEIKLTNNRVNYGDVEQTIVAITQVLTSFLIGDEIASISNDTDGRLLTLAETSEGPPKDPAKTAIVPKDPCKFCGRMHFHRNCFMPLILIEVSIAELTDHGVIGRASSLSAMASSSNLKIMVSFYVRVMQPLPEPDRTFMLELDSLQTIGVVIDEVASRFKVDKERIRVLYAGR